MWLLTIFLSLALISLSNGEAGLDPPGLAPLVTRANVLLSAGQFADAARAYTDAIDLAPASYLLFFKRATAYLSLNRHTPALEDFDTVLELTGGGFDKAYLMKAKIFTKEAQWGEARDMIKLYSNKVKGDRTAGDLLFSISEGEVATKKAHASQKSKSYESCVENSTKALQTAPYSTAIRRLRADCALAIGDLEQAVGDLTRLTHLLAPSTSLLLSISSLSYYLLPPSTQALGTLKQCLHFDPDSKPCRTAHRQIKAFDKQLKQLDQAMEAGEWRNVIKMAIGNPAGSGLIGKFDADLDEALKALPSLPLPSPLIIPSSIKPKTRSPIRAKLLKAACKAYVQVGEIRKGEPWCDELLKMDGMEKDEDALVCKGEAALKREEWEDAVRFFSNAFEAAGRSSQDIHARLQKAQKLLKQSKSKDYYKVLGVARDADLKTIKKAFRTAARSAHPDKGGSEAKMAAVNEAYEVLSDEDLRRRFDNGDDPNDPTSQQGPGGGNPFQGHPFAHFGFPGQQFGGQQFGGQGGFQFHWSG